jgi:hypothetical protein
LTEQLYDSEVVFYEWRNTTFVRFAISMAAKGIDSQSNLIPFLKVFAMF